MFCVKLITYTTKNGPIRLILFTFLKYLILYRKFLRKKKLIISVRIFRKIKNTLRHDYLNFSCASVGSRSNKKYSLHMYNYKRYFFVINTTIQTIYIIN